MIQEALTILKDLKNILMKHHFFCLLYFDDFSVALQQVNIIIMSKNKSSSS